jgi:hypothetical protein
MQGSPETTAAPTFFTHAPAANTAATKNIAAATGETWVLHWLHFSYDGVPAAVKTASVVIGGTYKWQVDITTAGVWTIEFPGGLYGSANEALVVTLPASGSGSVKGKINIKYT